MSIDGSLHSICHPKRTSLHSPLSYLAVPSALPCNAQHQAQSANVLKLKLFYFN